MRKCNMRWFSPQRMKKHLAFALAVSLVAMVPVSAFAQVLKISMTKTNVSIENVLRELEKQSDYTFFYNDNQVKLNKKVSINVSDAPIETVLDEVFKNSGYTYKIVDNQIVVSTAAAAAKEVQTTQQQKQRKISGVVKDAMGEAIIGASVIEKGNPTNGTITNIDGEFTLNTAGKELQVTYIGYIPQAIVLKPGVNSYTVTMKEDTKTLDEVVVVGYGTQKKVNLTGSVASVSTDEIKDRVQTNVLSAVQGTVPGVTVISRPGQTPSINFRGRGNLGTSSPLYVIDGAIADATFFSNLDPNSIESISFLKDAASSAIYGSRAAYGVVLVTTKQGKSDKMNVSYSGYVGLSNPTYKPEYVNSTQYAELYNEALYNYNPKGGKYQGYTEEEIGYFRDGSKPDLYPNTDWNDLVLDKNVLTTQHSLDFSGGTDKIRYFIGLGYVYKDNMIVLGGVKKVLQNNEGVYSDEMHLWNLKSGYWYELGKMPIGQAPETILVDHYIYLIGNRNGGGRSIECYNLLTGAWANAGRLLYRLGWPSLAYHNDIIYIFEQGVVQTFNIKSRQVRSYMIDLKLKSPALYYFDGKLYILGGFYMGDPSRNVYSVDLKEFDKTEVDYYYNNVR